MEPARSIVTKFGGPSAVAAIVGVHRTRVSNWMRPREKGGTGGLLPQKYHPALLEHAASHEIELKAEDFLPPRESCTADASAREPAT